MTLLDMVLKTYWAMETNAFQQVLNFVQRDYDPVELAKAMHSNYEKYLTCNPDALLKQDDEYLPGARNATFRKNVAVIPVVGPIIPRANLMSLSAASSVVGSLSKDFNIALGNSSIDTIIMNYETPGGEITGVSEFSQMISKAASESGKKVYSYIYGNGASAGYWLASSASEIWAGDTAQVGSIGVVTGTVLRDKADEKAGVQKIEIVSSVSPYKRASLLTDEGKNLALNMVNQLADIFVNTVAKNRNTTAEDVTENYGKGAMLLAKNALDAGMIDKIGSLEELIDANLINNLVGGYSMSLSAEMVKAENPEVYNAIFDAGKTAGVNSQKETASVDLQKQIDKAKAESAEAERTRIQGILSLQNHPGAAKIIQENIVKPEATRESVALLILEAKQTGISNLQNAMNEDNTSLLNQVKKIDGSAPESSEMTEEKYGAMIAKIANSMDSANPGNE